MTFSSNLTFRPELGGFNGVFATYLQDIGSCRTLGPNSLWIFRPSYTSRYLDDIFTIDNPELEKHIPDIYPAEFQLNKANTSDKETSFLDL